MMNTICIHSIVSPTLPNQPFTHISNLPCLLKITRCLILSNHPLIETINFIGRSNRKSSTLINSINLNIQYRSTRNSVRRLSSSLLHKKSERSSLKRKTKLRRRRRRGGVGKNALSLGKLLIHIGHKSSRITKGITISHVVVNELLVSWNILCCTEIGGGKDLAVRLDLDVGTGADPGFPSSIGKLTSFGSTSIGELIGSIIKSDENGSTRSINRHEGGYLITSSCSKKSSRLWPDSNHSSYSPVVIHNGGSIKRIPADGELSFSLFISIANFGVFLRGSLANDG
mmetsp:Transcript_3255/g.6095  ORF Transcript_3255/g.6095 Transcript_3255/m.6095 type:complete len:285 (-) Transcript_3255:175-1029(-)